MDRSSAIASGLPEGDTLGDGRYEVMGKVEHRGLFGAMVRATDRENGHLVAVQVLDREVFDGLGDALHMELTLASHLSHKNIVRVQDFGWDTEKCVVYVVGEHVDGHSLREALSRRRTAHSPGFSLKAAYNIIAHVCNALGHAHQTTVHGALCASNILVNRAGRVKIAEFGLSRAAPKVRRLQAQSAVDPAAMAPEVLTAKTMIDARTDIFACGALLCELITGRPPTERFVRPGAVTAGLSPDLDQIIARCLAPAPDDRFSDALLLKEALHAVVAGHIEGKGLSQSPYVGAGLYPPPPAPAAVRVSDLAGQDEEKWLIQKNNLDFGPFSLSQIAAQIESLEVRRDHIVVNHETGHRQKVGDHPYLQTVVERTEERQNDKRLVQAELAVVRKDRRRGVVLYAFLGVSILGLLGGAWLIRSMTREPPKPTSSLAALEGAQLDVAIAMKPPPPLARRPQTARRSPTSSDRSGSQDFDEPLDLGSAEDGEEADVLDDGQITPVVKQFAHPLGRCLRDSSERTAQIEFHIKGATGKVYAVRVNGSTTSSLASCIRGVMSDMRFPTCNSPRTRASFEMSY